MAYAMTQEDYKEIRNNRYTLIAFNKEGFRVSTESNYPMHRITESAIEYTKRGFIVKIWDQETANSLPRIADRIEDYQ